METFGPRSLSPQLPSPALRPALSQCCIRALGERTRSVGPSPFLVARIPHLPPRAGLLFVARPSAGDSVERVRRGPRPPGGGPSGRGGNALSRLRCHAAGGGGAGAARPLHGRRGSWRSSKGNGERAPAFSRLNFSLSEVGTKGRGHTLYWSLCASLQGKRLVDCTVGRGGSG